MVAKTNDRENEKGIELQMRNGETMSKVDCLLGISVFYTSTKENYHKHPILDKHTSGA